MINDPKPQAIISEADLFTVYGEALFLAQAMETGMRIFYWLDKKLPEALQAGCRASISLLSR